jgi:uracil phosphoribosyltransferase
LGLLPCGNGPIVANLRGQRPEPAVAATVQGVAPPVIAVDHPLVASWLTELRDETTGSARFRLLIRNLAVALLWEATRDIATEPHPVRTPLTDMVGTKLAGLPALLVPVLRAGAWMIDGCLSLLPDADVGMVGMARDERTLQPVTYVDRLPATVDPARPVYVLDPMLATGGSLCAVGALLTGRGVESATVLSVLAAPEGLRRVNGELPAWRIVTAGVDDRLDERGFIVPGLGDAGDRLSG